MVKATPLFYLSMRRNGNHKHLHVTWQLWELFSKIIYPRQESKILVIPRVATWPCHMVHLLQKLTDVLHPRCRCNITVHLRSHCRLLRKQQFIIASERIHRLPPTTVQSICCGIHQNPAQLLAQSGFNEYS